MSTSVGIVTRPALRAEPVAFVSVVALLAWTAWSFWAGYTRHFAVVHNPAWPQWWEWTDQGRYYQSAKAWSELSLDPARHWYFPLYPMLGALFIRFLPGHPFEPPDLACLLAFAALFVVLARCLSRRGLAIVPVAAAVFVGTVLFTKYELKAFIEPWTTTPVAPLELAALILTMRLWERPGAGRAIVAGLPLGVIFFARPTDVLPVGLAVACCTAAALRRAPWRLWWRSAVGGVLGALLPATAAIACYWTIFGWHENAYLQQSAQTGFEWRLLPLHWVTLMVSPLPEFRDYSLAQTFAWIPPGVAGMVACLVACRGRDRLRHALVISAVGLHCLLYLSYRDLHPPGLLRFGNYHYFKWCLPLFGLYAAFLLTEMHRPRLWTAWASGLAVTLALFSWRMEWRPVPAPWLDQARVEGGHTLELPQPPRSVYDGLFVPAAGAFAPIYLSSYEMRVGGRVFRANADFKAFPADGGLILTVLRPMPAGETAIDFPKDVALLPGEPHLLRAHLFWRLPRPLQYVSSYALRWLKTGDR